MNTETSCAAIVLTASANRTACRACAGQYPGAGLVTTSPLSAPTQVMVGAE